MNTEIFLYGADAKSQHGFHQPKICSKTASYEYISSRHEVGEDYFTNIAKCINESFC